MGDELVLMHLLALGAFWLHVLAEGVLYACLNAPFGARRFLTPTLILESSDGTMS